MMGKRESAARDLILRSIVEAYFRGRYFGDATEDDIAEVMADPDEWMQAFVRRIEDCCDG